MASKFKIVNTAVTFFDKHGQVETDGYRDMLRSIDPYVDMIFTPGTNAEFPALSISERAEVTRAAVDVFGGDRVVAHVGAASLFQAQANLNAVANFGIRNVAAITPFYLERSDDVVMSYYQKLRSAISGRLYAYIYPDVTGVDVTPNLLRRLGEVGVNGAKLSGRAAYQIEEFRRVAPDMELWSGNDFEIERAFRAGADGIASGLSCVIPELLDRFRRSLARNSDDAVLGVCREALSIARPALTVHKEDVRYGLKVRGFQPGMPRMRTCFLSAERKEAIKAAVDKIQSLVRGLPEARDAVANG